MSSEAAKVVVPESVLRKRKREELWAAEKKTKAVEEKKKSSENRKVIFARAKQYSEEYDAHDKELVQLKREARMKGGFYVSPESKLLFVVRIRGINAMHPKTRKILQLLRLRQVNKATINMLHRVEPYVAYGLSSPRYLYPETCQLVCVTASRRRRRRERRRAHAISAASTLSTMPCRRSSILFILVILSLLSSVLSVEEEARALSVGQELVGETMPLRHGRRLYRLAGLRPPAWYEVKISYPASIPSSFSIRLVNDPDATGDWGSKNRRLLNTEKIIFKAESSDPVYVLVTVEPEGVVAKPNVPERELALFNIVCDELLLGIPHFAWWVGIAAVFCIVLASLAPYFLPLHKLLNYEGAESSCINAESSSIDAFKFS